MSFLMSPGTYLVEWRHEEEGKKTRQIVTVVNAQFVVEFRLENVIKL